MSVVRSVRHAECPRSRGTDILVAIVASNVIVLGKADTAAADGLLLLSVRVELLEERDQIVGLLLILQSGIDHFRARNLGLRVLDVRWPRPR